MSRKMAGINHEHVFSRGNVTISKGQPDRFEHSTIHVVLVAPPGWQLVGSGESSDGGDMAMFSTSNFKYDTLGVWMRSADGEGNDISGILERLPGE